MYSEFLKYITKLYIRCAISPCLGPSFDTRKIIAIAAFPSADKFQHTGGNVNEPQKKLHSKKVRQSIASLETI